MMMDLEMCCGLKIRKQTKFSFQKCWHYSWNSACALFFKLLFGNIDV